MSQVHDISAMDSSGVVRCYSHGLEASLMTSRSASNPGREYYCCSKDRSDPERCSFWYWADDPMFQKRDRNSAASSSHPNTPTSSQSGQPTTPSRKRSLPTSQDSLEMTPSQKRKKLIEEALKTPTTPQTQGVTPKSALRSPQKSQKRLEDIQLALSTNSHMGTKTSHSLVHPSSPTPTRITSSHPSVSSSRNLGKLPANSVGSENSDDEDAELWDRVTPPRTLENVMLGAQVGTVSTENDSQGTIAGPSYSNWRDYDQENPFAQSRQLSNSTAKSSSYVPALSSFSPVFSDQSAGTSSSSTIRSFDEITERMAKLERKLMASERCNSAKAKRISELEEIIERLQEELENRALGGSVNSYLLPRH